MSESLQHQPQQSKPSKGPIKVSDLFRAQTKKLEAVNAAARRADDPEAAAADDAAAQLRKTLADAKKSKMKSMETESRSTILSFDNSASVAETPLEPPPPPSQIPMPFSSLNRRSMFRRQSTVSATTTTTTTPLATLPSSAAFASTTTATNNAKRKAPEPEIAASSTELEQPHQDKRSRTTVTEVPPTRDETTEESSRAATHSYSAVQLVTGGPLLSNGRGSRLLSQQPQQQQQQRTILAPNVRAMKKNERKAGGGNADQPSVWFYACYENSALLGAVLGTLADFSDNYTIIFNDRGMKIAFDDDGKLLHLHLEVPRSAFVAFEDLCDSAISFVISSKKIKRFSKKCSAATTLTFCLNQNGNKGEPLELILCPLDGDFDSGVVTRAGFKPIDEEKSVLMPAAPHQYQVTMPAALYKSTIVGLVSEGSDICMELSSARLKLSSIDADGGGDLYSGIPVKPTLEEAMQKNCCYVERVLGADPAIQFNSMPEVRFIAAYLESVTRFSGAGVSKVVLRFGLREKRREPGKKEDSPLYVSYTFAEATPAAFTLQTWLAPTMELE